MHLTPAFASGIAADVAPIDYGKVFLVSFLGAMFVALIAFSLRGLWLIFEKAGVEGWKAAIPAATAVFLGVLVLGLAYEFKRGALEWEK